MKKTNIILIVCIISVVLLSIGCDAPATDVDGTVNDVGTGEIAILRIGGAGAGGGYYVLGGAVGNVLTESGLPAAVQTTGGGRQNAILIDEGEIDVGLTNNIEAYIEFAENGRDSIRTLAPAFSGQHHFVVRADYPIESVSDLQGTNFGLTASGSTHDVAGRQIFDILNINADLVNADRGDTASMVRDGMLVGFFMSSAYPISTISELEVTTDLRFLKYTDEEFEKIKQQAPWLYEDVITAGAYANVDEDLKTFGSWNIFIVREGVNDDTVYRMLEILYDNSDKIKEIYASAQLEKEYIVQQAIPLHPGAVKYYRDQGITIPDHLIPPEME